MVGIIDDDALNKLLKDAENEIIERVELRKECAYIAANLLAQEEYGRFEETAERVLAWITKGIR